jgi:CRISPR-associated protein Cas8a1/Csx13
MQQRRSASKNSTIRPRIELDLTAPNLTLLHRVGVAGLWMTLKQLEQQYPMGRRPGHLTWSLSPQRIELHWQGNDFDVLDWLFRQAFQINNDGLIALTGLAPQRLNIQTQLVIHQGITGTFLQHNQFLKTAGQATKILKIDDQEIAIKYKRAVSYAHQSFATTLCDRGGNLSTNPVRIVGWLYPGAVARHYRFADKTKFEETPELAFALLFAPVACRYFILPKQLQRGLAQYALVIPEVEDLEQYAICSWTLKDLNYIDFYVAGMGDAGLKYLVYAKSCIKR